MRRLLAAAVFAAAVIPAVPANAVCAPSGQIRVCGVVDCSEGYCDVQPYVDPQCTQNHIHTLHCKVINDLYVPLPALG